jgi:NhaA family Na+:H+ antiporter
VFYADGVAGWWLLGALGAVLVIVLAQRIGIGLPIAYVVPAVALWVCMQQSGVHATLAGVVLGLLTPARAFGGRDVIERLEARFHPWSSLLVVPLFALANAGVRLDAVAIERASSSRVTWGIVAGLVVGKPLGIVAASAVALRFRLARLPAGVTLGQLACAGCVAGIGFTVSLFVADLSFGGVALSEAKVGILAATLVSAAIGIGLLVVRSGVSQRAMPR